MKIIIKPWYKIEDYLSKIYSILINLGADYEETIYEDHSVEINYDFSEKYPKLKEKIKKEKVQIDFDDHTLFNLMLMAHEQDITLNELVENILREQIEKEKVDG